MSLTHRPLRIAIIGATGVVGRTMIQELAASSLHKRGLIDQVGLFASPRSEGLELPAGTGSSTTLTVKAFSYERMKGYDVALMSAGGDFSLKHSPTLARQGMVVIDNSSAWRQHPGAPLVVPEVNDHELEDSSYEEWSPGRIIANPNCSTIQMMVGVGPLEKAFRLKKIIVSTYQSVSGSGAQGLSELRHQYHQIAAGETPTPNFYPQPIAGNVLACIGDISPSGHAWEEAKMMLESQKILCRDDLFVMATAVRVPVLYGHGQSVICELDTEVTRSMLYDALKGARGLVVQHDDDADPLFSPLGVTGKRETYVSRIRLGTTEVGDDSSSVKNNLSPSHSHSHSEKPTEHHKSSWVQMWNVADNITKGAATNAVQILQALAQP